MALWRALRASCTTRMDCSLPFLLHASATFWCVARIANAPFRKGPSLVAVRFSTSRSSTSSPRSHSWTSYCVHGSAVCGAWLRLRARLCVCGDLSVYKLPNQLVLFESISIIRINYVVCLNYVFGLFLHCQSNTQCSQHSTRRNQTQFM